MVALILLALIAVEAAVFCALGIWLMPARWLSGASLLGIAIAGIVLVRAVMAGTSFLVAWRYRTPRNGVQKIGWLSGIALYLRETGAQVLAFTILQPLSMWFTPRDDTAFQAQNRMPILLVHGLWCNAAIWWRFAARLRRAQIGPLFTITLEPPLADIDALAQQLAAKIEKICARTNAARVTVIAHSMGGLVARAYLRRAGTQHIATLITLGSPHHGSALARLSFGHCVRQMRPGNVWLQELARGEERARLSAVSIYTVHDNLVAPQASSVLANVTNVPLTGIGHVELLFRRDVVERVLRELDSRRASAREERVKAA